MTAFKLNFRKDNDENKDVEDIPKLKTFDQGMFDE